MFALRFTICDVCHALKRDIANKLLTPAQRCAALQLYRGHVAEQYRDRQALWSMQSVSGEALSQLGDVSGNVITVLVDGCDQSKFCIPRDPALRSTADVCPWQCLRGHVCESVAKGVAATAHGQRVPWGVAAFEIVAIDLCCCQEQAPAPQAQSHRGLVRQCLPPCASPRRGSKT
jgi:hypothetical protein